MYSSGRNREKKIHKNKKNRNVNNVQQNTSSLINIYNPYVFMHIVSLL